MKVVDAIKEISSAWPSFSSEEKGHIIGGLLVGVVQGFIRCALFILYWYLCFLFFHD
jgi:hypothetical protein